MFRSEIHFINRQDGLKDILFMCIYMQMCYFFHGLQGVDFLGKQTRSTVGNTGERFRLHST